jgi:nitrous oxidase accessory protein
MGQSHSATVKMTKRVFSSLVFLLMVGVGYATHLTVCKTCESTDLAQAVSKAENGDVITVKKGRYATQKLVIEKAITIQGETGAILDGEGYTILYVHHDRVSISGLQLEGVSTNYVEDRAAIKCNDSDYLTIRNVTIRKSFFGILIEKSKHGIIEGCDIEGDVTAESYLESANGNAIHLWYCEGMTIRNNRVAKHRDGIYFEFVEESVIQHNLSTGNMRYGLHFMFSHHNEYQHNIFSKNGAGVAVMYSDHVVMEHNQFVDNWGESAYGLLIKDITDSQLRSNVFRNNTIAISADNSSRVEVKGNRFEGNGYALRVMGNCTDNQVIGNDFVANSFDVVTNASSNYNTFSGNYWEEYAGYDLDRDGVGDVPFRPVKLFTYIIAQSPASIILMRSSFIDLLNLAEKVTPVLTPESLIDSSPIMHVINDHLNVRL